MINLNTCDFVIWGFRNEYDTFGHIHEAWYRALKHKFPDRRVTWIDEKSDLEEKNFHNALVLTINIATGNMPKRKDCFYVIHNIDEKVKASFGDMRQFSIMNYGMFTSTMDISDPSLVEVGFETYLSLQLHEAYSCVVLRWGTDLFPDEIEANKPTQVYNPDSRVINFVGTPYENVHGPFREACKENGIQFNIIGGFSSTPPVSIQENARLVRASYMAPAIGDAYHAKVGYIPCRTYKNISYGCLPLTNNPYAQQFFRGRLICNTDTYQLFHDAKIQLPLRDLSVLHDLMDEVAENHTYLTKVDSLLRAVQLTQEARG